MFERIAITIMSVQGVIFFYFLISVLLCCTSPTMDAVALAQPHRQAQPLLDSVFSPALWRGKDWSRDGGARERKAEVGTTEGNLHCSCLAEP